ncbi:unnamed protein product [Vitrella brassicaformis CCMP3155]|uniref:Uncharacterized protein n=1 Tax=Vitrella brassicaformis (strain CCMP3155) TaxID=1169540 RepID=A0A0G4GRB4_VITBC|nr:unnamed protein product [Vitrella brassicaformis CCMP3155]|eukprot:CEM33067.1 unnamed protein product [Vitrella brassicaformis CCMP3155]
MEDDRQVESSRHDDAQAASAAAASSASAGGGGGVSERERNLRQQISDTPGLLSIVMAFLPLHLLVRVSKKTWQQAAPRQHRLVISAEDREERSLWQRVPMTLVNQLAALLTQLTCVVLCYPIDFPLWVFDVFVAMVEGHIAARRAANMEGGTLHTITVEGVRLTRKEMETVTRTHPPLPPLADPPPALPALTTIVAGGVVGCQPEPIHQSIKLRCVGGDFDEGEWAGVFEGIPETPPGQQGGPLSQLEAIGTIKIRGDSTDQLGVERLQCRPRHFPVLLALDRLATECCRQDAPVTFTSSGSPGWTYFDLNLFYHSEFPIHPSPWLKSVIQQVASDAAQVKYTITQDDLTDDLRNPSQAAIDIANPLTFDNAIYVGVDSGFGFDPPGNADSPHPSIIAHLPFQPFPKATSLQINTRLGAAGRLLADKMPDKVTRADIRVLRGGEAVTVLEALGSEREVGEVEMRGVGVDQLVGAAGGLPKIKWITMTLPDDADVEEDAGSYVHARLSSLIQRIRGLQYVTLGVHSISQCPRPAVVTDRSRRGVGELLAVE